MGSGALLRVGKAAPSGLCTLRALIFEQVEGEGAVGADKFGDFGFGGVEGDEDTSGISGVVIQVPATFEGI